MRITVVRAWPDGHEEVELHMPEAATVADAVDASGLSLEGIAGYAVFGVRMEASIGLHDGDRVELLRPLLADPKETRRRRAAAQRPRNRKC